MPAPYKDRSKQNQKKVQNKQPVPPAKPQKKSSKNYLAIALIAIVAVATVAFVAYDQHALFYGQSTKPTPTPTITPTTTATNNPSASAAPLTSPAGEYSAGGTRVVLVTSMGNITIQLRDDKPITTANFLNLTRMGIYDNTIFHRVIAGFMVQGGDPTGTGYGSPSIDTIKDEIGNVNTNINSNGTIAMANTGAPNSASSQFFINVADNQNLYPSFDSSYTVFGQVIQGMNVVMAISHVPVDQTTDKPLQNVTLIQAIVLPN